MKNNSPHRLNFPACICLLLTICLAVCCRLPAQAQKEDRNVVIESKTQEFNFSKGSSDHPVMINEKYTNRYRCDEVRTEILFSELYNENESIDDIDIRVDDKKAKGVTPKYEYYSVENIFYSDAKVCYFKLPLEKKGSHSEVKLEKSYKDPRYFNTVYFNENFFTENKTVVFRIPRWMKAELLEYNFDGYNIKKSSTYDQKDDEDVISYSMLNLKAYRSEEDAPGGSFIYPHLLVLCKEADVQGNKVFFFKTLADQYKWYHQLVLNLGDDKQLLQQKAKELTAGMTDDKEKIKTIYNWVQHNIRYLAFEDGLAGFKPARAQDVLNKKYGDCKGMANLTRGLLASLGYDARLCWIGTNHIAYDYSTPSLAVDNHMICGLLFKGKTYFLDATETNIGFDEYAERIQGRQVLMEDGNNYLLERVPSVLPEQNTELEKASLNFDGTENLKGKVSITYKGESRSSLLSKIESTKMDNLQKALTNYLSESNLNYEIQGLQTSPLFGIDTILSISYDVSHRGAASSFGDEIYLEADYPKELDGFIIDTSKRLFDFMLPYRMNLLTEMSIAVPAGYKVNQLPPNKEWKHPNIFISIRYSKQGDKIEYKKQIRIPDIRLKKSSFGDWNRIMKELSSAYKEQLIFEKK
jgi:Transglutaminase-like superfamily/Domain of Unknown Function with PDB structure (DUF3858)